VSLDRPPGHDNGRPLGDAVSTIHGERYLAEYATLLDGSQAMRSIRAIVENIADTDATVLIRGESGVSKDLVARAIHAASRRCSCPFIKVNCAAIPAGLLESELFGHEKGAFTGAHRRKPGQFEYAHKGTIYLDEIAELPSALQAKLLHVLQDLRFARVGGHGMIDVDTRIVAATNRDLEQALAAVSSVKTSTTASTSWRFAFLRCASARRRSSSSLSASWRGSTSSTGGTRSFSPATTAKLLQYAWRGNVRELENMIRRLVVLHDAEEVFDHLVTRRQRSAGPLPPRRRRALTA